MTVAQTKYYPGKNGLGTEFGLSEMPLEYMRKFTNRFINLQGNAEKRQGMIRLGNQVTGNQSITGLHEFINKFGVLYLFSSGGGNIYRHNETTDNWDVVLTGKNSTKRLLSVQMAGKLIFVNGSDRNFYTDDGGATFHELKALMEVGTASSTATNSISMTDAQITNWDTQTLVTNNDLVHNITLDAYGVVTSAGATNISVTNIGVSAAGLGQASRSPASGDFYEIIDLIEMNILPVGVGFDNFGTLTSGSSTTQISVSGVDFSTTEIRTGDYVYNTTRNAVLQVGGVSANIAVTSCKSQTAGDSIELFKSAMPISSWPHVHYRRFYSIDARNEGLVRVSGPDDPQDFSTDQLILTADVEDFTSRQPQAEKLLSIKTFMQYLVVGGQRNVYIDSGTNPSATSAQAVDIKPVGLFPQGCVSRFALENLGGTMIFGANDGIRNFVSIFNSETFQTTNLSEAIKSEITKAIANKVVTDTDEIQAIHYPRRNWMLFKIGDTIYNYNYTPQYSQGTIQPAGYGSFSTFTGKFANQQVYYVRRNGDLLCADDTGRIYEFDKGNYDDDGDSIPTILETAFLDLSEPQEGTQSRSGCYIRPIFETSLPITYTIEAKGGYDETGNDLASATTTGVGMVDFGVVGSSPIGGSRVFDQKLPLRWKGRQFKVQIGTDSTDGPDIIIGFTIYGNILGKQ